MHTVAPPKVGQSRFAPQDLGNETRLFKVNTGCRDQEVCGLRWEWEVAVPELDTSVFLIPGDRVKNGDERLVVLNRVARSVVESVRGQHPEFVFAYRGRRIETMRRDPRNW
jgi:integrase